MMREPVEKSVGQFHVHSREMPEQEADSSSKTWSDGRRGDFAGFGDNSVVVHQLMLWRWQLEDLGEDGINSHILRLPSRFFTRYFLEPVKRRSTLDEGIWCPEAIGLDKEFGSRDAVKVEDVDCVYQHISDKA